MNVMMSQKRKLDKPVELNITLYLELHELAGLMFRK